MAASIDVNCNKQFDRQRFVSVLGLRHAQLRNLVGRVLTAISRVLAASSQVLAASSRVLAASSRVLAASARVLAARTEPVYFFRSNLCRFRSKFAWALPLSLYMSSPLTMNFFSEMTNTDKK